MRGGCASPHHNSADLGTARIVSIAGHHRLWRNGWLSAEAGDAAVERISRNVA